MTHSEFKELTLELKSGNNGSLKTIFEQHSSSCISKLISDFRCTREDAHDIYVDSVLNFREKIISNKLDAVADVRAYLFGTCKNMLLFKLKQKQRVATAVMEISHVSTAYLEHDEPAPEEFQSGLLSLTYNALSAVPVQCQQLLRLFYFDRMSLEEISTRMNLANANVAKVSKSRCFRKLINLIKDLQNQRKHERIE
jgi:RNA polymerase sigma factor (sigma-70 family)